MDWNELGDRLGVFGEKVGKSLKSMFGSENERVVRTMVPLIKRINELEPWAQELDRDGMQAKMAEFKAAVADGTKTLDDLLPEVFAMTREASVRTLGLRPYDVQLVGGHVLHQGRIAEMMTGEGKTLVATLPLALNSLAGRRCYLVTVNDYLAMRDANWMRPIFEYLGLTVGSIQASMNPWDRKPVYACDIVYSTNNELGFDYLRDNMKTRKDEQVQTDLFYAIVDEVDSVLIDEARTPLIISGPAEEHVGKYHEADQVVRKLERDEHYEVKEKEKSASLTEDGIVRAQELLQIESFYQPGFEDWPHYIENSIRAYEIYQNDKEYVVEEVEDERRGTKAMEVVIVDEFTGRKMHGRRWSDGLHQAVEVKEGLEPKQETQTLATITFQNYFRMFEKLAGMTGTAITEAGEFHKIYDLDVVSVPPNRPVAREDGADIVYRTEPEKWNAIVEEIERLHGRGQPVLVGTASVENSEKVAGLLTGAKVPHAVLNAKNNEAEKNAREAVIVAKAGELGAVTVATNMAGRGTDIKLGGNFEHRLAVALDAKELAEGDEEHLAEIDAIREQVREQCESDEADVLALGGLYVLSTERHEARRIDNQLRGRSGRQGDAGESRFFLSLQDPLMRIFYRDWVTNAMEKLGMSEGQAIESKMVSRAIAKAQRKVEDRNFEIRKSLLEYDEVMNTQRKTIYGVRQAVLENELMGQGGRTRVQQMMHNVAERQALVYLDDPEGFQEWFHKTFGFEVEMEAATLATEAEEKERQLTGIYALIDERYEARCAELGEQLTERVEQYLLLNAIDGKWKDHLHAVDSLKTGIGLRGYGQQDPKTIYKQEGTQLFHEQLLPAIESEIASLVLRIEVRRPDEQAEAEADGTAEGAGPGLAPRGMISGTPSAVGAEGAAQPSPAQVAAARRQFNQNMARRAMRQKTPASSAFDLVQRNQPQRPEAPPEDIGKAGRNDPCPCGSGKKFKKCHGASSMRGAEGAIADVMSGSSQVPGPIDRDPNPGLWTGFLYLVYDLIWLLAILLTSPWWLGRSLIDRGFRGMVCERLTLPPPDLLPPAGRPRVLVHGVSVGEVKAAQSIVSGLSRDHEVVVCASTDTGLQVARQTYPGIPVVRFPLDLSLLPARFLRAIDPDLIVLMELEVWPHFLRRANRTGVPVAIVNGRITEESFANYKRLFSLTLPQFNRVSLVAAQNERYAERFRQLAGSGDRVVVAGNVKADGLRTGARAPDPGLMRLAAGRPGQAVLVAGSTHDPEELLVRDAFQRAAPDARMILVPRHPERAAAVVAALSEGGVAPQRLTELRAGETPDPSRPLVVDTIGELEGIYGLADLVYVGGSLVPHGGHNMLEPAAQGCPVLYGPHLTNFAQEASLLEDAGGARRVEDAAGLCEAVAALITDPQRRAEMAAAGVEAVEAQKGATAWTLELLHSRCLPRSQTALAQGATTA